MAKKKGLIIRPLYLLSGILGISAALIALSRQGPDPEPSDEQLAKKIGFNSYAELYELGKLVDAHKIEKLSAREGSLLADVLTRESGSRWYAVSAVSHLATAGLQKEFIDDMYPIFRAHPEDFKVRDLLHQWINRGGRSNVVELSRSPDQKVSQLAKGILKERPVKS